MAIKTTSVRVALNHSHMAGLDGIMDAVRGLRLETDMIADDGSVFWVKGHEMAVDALLQKLAGSGRRAETLMRFYAAAERAQARLGARRARVRDQRRLRWLRLAAPLLRVLPSPA